MSVWRTVIRGGDVVTVDPDLGTIPGGDVLIEDGVLVAIVAPGTVDAHTHSGRLFRRAPAACSRTGPGKGHCTG